jgi:hexosaminidase
MHGGIAAAQAGHDVVMAPTSHTYFDYYQGPSATEPRAIGGFIPWEKVYQFEPIPEQLTAEQAVHVLGGQGQLWGEFIPDREHREYMTYPRACALSEVLWSPAAPRRADLFRGRLAEHLERLAAAGVNFRPLDPEPSRRPGRENAAAPRGPVRRPIPELTERPAPGARSGGQ